MRVTHLSLGDFRNYQQAEVSFRPGLNLIVGRNGQGKTNLIEAMCYFSTLGSHRVSSDSALIRAGAEAAVARMRLAADAREVLLEAQINRSSRNRAQVNRNGVPPRELTRWFSSVLFAPEDLLLVRGDPGVRRRFLDESVLLRHPSLSATISDYERVVRQRTALLKSARNGDRSAQVESTLEIWNEQLIALGVSIMLARRDLVHSLRVPLRDAYESIVEQNHRPHLRLLESVASAREEGDVSRETSQPLGAQVAEVGSSPEIDDHCDQNVSRETLVSQFREALLLVRQRELERGVTLVGPHRDDVLFELNGLPVKGYASHGESWSFVLSLRLAVAMLLRNESASGDPVIFLDDVFAELDVKRRDALMAELLKFEQVIVTAAVEADVPVGDWSRTEIYGGAVVEPGDARASGGVNEQE